MTEPDEAGDIRYCVNGCMRTIDNGRARTPARATTGNLCRSCIDRLDRWLTEIPERYALLPEYLLPTADLDANPEAKATKRPTAPVPVRLAALDLLDERLGRKWLATVAADERRGTIGTLLAIANEIRAARASERVRDSYVVTEADYVRGGLAVLAHSDGVADAYSELRTLHRELGDAVGQYPPRPVGACFLVDQDLPHTSDTCPCDCAHDPGMLADPDREHDCRDQWQEANQCRGPLLPIETGVVCVTCGAKWNHLQLRLLGANLEVPA